MLDSSGTRFAHRMVSLNWSRIWHVLRVFCSQVKTTCDSYHCNTPILLMYSAHAVRSASYGLCKPPVIECFRLGGNRDSWPRAKRLLCTRAHDKLSRPTLLQ